MELFDLHCDTLGECLKAELWSAMLCFFLKVNFVHVFLLFLLTDWIVSEYCTCLE